MGREYLQNLFANAQRPRRPAAQRPGPAPESPVLSAPSPRGTAGAAAPVSLASSSQASAPAADLHFEKRNVPAPEIPGIRAWADALNRDPRPPREVLADLREARTHFAGLRERGEQTRYLDGERSNRLINPILNAENARHPGLNAAGCADEKAFGAFLEELSKTGGPGGEGHVRFHLGIVADMHRVAVDAYRHREGGFTLVAVDSMNFAPVANALAKLEAKHPSLIKGAMIIPTPNQAHGEGCRIFGVHTLNAMHDFQPHVRSLHRQLYDPARGRTEAGLPESTWKRVGGNTHVLADRNAAFGLLPGKFFKHLQVLKPKEGGTRTVLDEAESRNPALKHEALNKKGQTLRERFASQNPGTAPEDFSRADRTASLDRKRLVLIDRAIAHYEGVAAASGD